MDPIKCDPPRRTRKAGTIKREAGPVQRNMLKASTTPGEWWLVSSYKTRNAAQTASSEFRGGLNGRRPPLAGKWEYAHGVLPDDPERFGLWVRYLGPDEERKA